MGCIRRLARNMPRAGWLSPPQQICTNAKAQTKSSCPKILRCSLLTGWCCCRPPCWASWSTARISVAEVFHAWEHWEIWIWKFSRRRRQRRLMTKSFGLLPQVWPQTEKYCFQPLEDITGQHTSWLELKSGFVRANCSSSFSPCIEKQKQHESG